MVSERINGLARIHVRTYAGEEHEIDFPEEVYTVTLGDNREFASDTIRLGYTSMITPASVFDYRVDARELTVRKVQEIPSGYEKSRYVTRRLMAPAKDGAQVPITIVHRDDYPVDGTGRLYLYAYGAYGHGLDPAFNAHRLSLLDRGFAWALAHVRGGDELGWRWYEDGKLDKKENSFGDFIACAEHLVRAGYGRAGEIAVRGRQRRRHAHRRRCKPARGAVALRHRRGALRRRSQHHARPIASPHAHRVARVGQSDRGPRGARAGFSATLLATMFGRRPTRPCLLTAGISDPRVTYWEPAKLAARLRATKMGDSLLLLKTNMEAGHFGRSGRFEMLREVAEQFAFVLHCFGLAAHGEGDPIRPLDATRAGFHL